ncbi:FxSxx-COOH system tetratricopeptide repeat protein [Dactylosporangium sp. CS-033363]|uniref:FxSxx-COOH system tetratricopeptide repeat protein n=1 Tax=Dactylosporangium sp. CS-033363 TaxID=3239935 RepID=UPI003D8A2269
MNLEHLRPLLHGGGFEELALLVDAGPSMPLWEPTLAELRRDLAALGGPAVTEFPLGPDLRLPPARRLALIVTDGVGPLWDGTLGPLLERLGREGPTAVFQLLPYRMWSRSRPAVHRVRLSAPGPLAANADLRAEAPDGRFDPARAGVAIPVLELTPRWLAPWAALVAGTATGPVPGAALFTGRPVEDPADDEPAPRTPPSAERRVRVFRASASPTAYRLAGLLAAAPLTLPLMRLVAAERLPEARPEHLAEVFLGGLLRQRTHRGHPAEHLAGDDRRAGRQRAVEHATERTVEHAAERAVEHATEHATGRAVEHATERAGEHATGRAVEHATERAGEHAAERAGEHATERAGEHAAERAGEHATERAGEHATERAVEHAAERAVEHATEHAAERAGEHATERAVEHFAGRVTEHVAGNVADVVGDGPRAGFEFRPGVREALLPSLHAAEALGVVRLVADRLGPADLDAAVVSGDPAALRALGEQFVAATVPVLRSLGGAHAELAEALAAPPATSGPLAGSGAADGSGSVTEVDVVARFAERAAEREGDGPTGGGGTAGERDVHVKTPQQVRNAVPQRNSGFVGRDGVLDEIGRRLDSGLVALLPDARHSLGGTGKTQLALEYAHRFAGEYDLVWWVPAEQVAPMRVALAGLARALKVRESNDLNRTLQALRETLERGSQYRRWLLIFDNASRPEDIEPYLPRGIGHVLVTSRNPRWADMGHAIEIGAFTRAESVLLLRRRSPAISGSQAHTLAARLGDVPMAMEQAAATQNATGWTAAEYVERYDVLRREMGGTSERPEYPSPIVVTWNLAYAELAERNPGAARLLDVCAFLAGEPVSWNVLWESRGAGLPAPLGSLVRVEKALRTALRELDRFGLAQVDPALQSVQVHRLGQLLLLERLEVKEYPIYQQAAHDVLTAADPAIPDDPASWPRYEELSAHLLYSDLLAGATDESRQLMLHYVRFLFVRGDHDSSRTVAQHAYDRWRLSLSDEHEDTLAAAYHLANAMRAGGDAAEAAKLNQQTLATLRRVFGDDDESTLMTANSVGADLRLRGEFVAARNVDLDNLDRYRRLFGEAYPRTLRCANNLAVDMRLLGDFRQARVIDEQTLMHRRRVLPHPHPETLWSLISLAHNRFGLGEHEVAIEILTDALPLHADAFGEDHSAVLTGRRYLAMALRRGGAYARARKEAEATMALWLEKYGDHSADTLSAILTYANCVRACGEFATSRAAAQQAADGFTAILGERHPFTHAAQAALAAALRAEGDPGAAGDLDRHALVGLAHSVGAEHPFSVACAIGYASDLALSGQSAGAVIASRDTVRVAQTYGAQHPALLVAVFNHALDVRSAHPSGDDRGTVGAAAEALRRRLGDTHPATLTAFAGRRLEFDIELPAT